MSKKIYEPTLIYSILRCYTKFIFKRWFSTIESNGESYIPRDSAVIFAPNHQNALIDAMALLQTSPEPVVFLARADLFKDKIAAFLLRVLRIMPAYRKRDGMSNLKKNEETFEQSKETLLNKKYLCLMPEGGQDEFRRLRPLVKGIFRIAFSTQEELSKGEYVKIVPVGIDYGNYDHTGRHLIVNFGKAISLKDYLDEYAENAPLTINKIRKDLSNRIECLMLNIKSESNYDTIYTTSYLYNKKRLDDKNYEDNETNRLIARQEIAKELDEIDANNKNKIDELRELCDKWRENNKDISFSSRVSEESKSFDLNLFNHILFLIFGSLPLLYSLLFNILPFASFKFLSRRAKGTGFEASFMFGMSAVLIPIYYFIIMIVAIFFIHSFMYWIIFAISLPLSFFYMLRYRWRLQYVKERLKNIFSKSNLREEIINKTDELLNNK